MVLGYFIVLGLIIIGSSIGLAHIVQEGFGKVVHGQRMSVALELKGSQLFVNPEMFEPNRERLLTNLFVAIKEETHSNPGTWAYCVLNRSGVSEFIDGSNRLRIQNALGRLRANGDDEGCRAFAKEIMKQL